MATLDTITFSSNDSSNQTVSAYFVSTSNYSIQSGVLLASTSHPTVTDSNGNNFTIQFQLNAAQTAAFQSGQNYIEFINNTGSLYGVYNSSGNVVSTTGYNSIAYPGTSFTQTTYNTTGPAGQNGTNGTNGTNGAPGAMGATGSQGPAGPQGATGATGAVGPAGPQGATGDTGAQGIAGSQGTAGATGLTGPQGATGPQGPQGAPGITATSGRTAAAGIQFVATVQNVDGTTTFSFAGGSYFDTRSYYALSDTRTADNTLLTETRAQNDGSFSTSVYQPGQTVASQGNNLFLNNGQSGTTFVFDPGHGLDVVQGFQIGTGADGALSFRGSDFNNSIANVLHNSHNVAGGVVIVDPTATDAGTHDRVFLAGVSKGQLVQNYGDITFHG